MKRILLLTLVVITLPGCGKNRWLSRRDYSEMQDPFAEAEADGYAASAATGAGTSGRSGRARVNTLGEPLADSHETAQPLLRGPKPIQRASATTGTAGGSAVSNAVYPQDPESNGNTAQSTRSYEGPALSDFLQGKPPRPQVSAAQIPSELNSDPRSLSAGLPSGATINRTMTPPQMPVSAAAEEFGSFLNQKSGQVQQAVQSGQEAAASASATAGDFDSWVNQQQQQWAQTAGAATDTAAAVPAQVQQTAAEAARSARKTALSAIPDFDSLADESEQSAVPLMKNVASRKQETSRAADTSGDFDFDPAGTTAETAARPASTRSAGSRVFDNPFADEPDSTTAVQKPATRSSVGDKEPVRSADDEQSGGSLFGEGTGWKPSHLTRP